MERSDSLKEGSSLQKNEMEILSMQRINSSGNKMSDELNRESARFFQEAGSLTPNSESENVPSQNSLVPSSLMSVQLTAKASREEILKKDLRALSLEVIADFFLTDEIIYSLDNE